MPRLFTSLCTSVLLSSLLISITSFATEITLTTSDNFSLKADYYPGENTTQKLSNSAVLMLHQCNYNRTMYNAIGEQLAQRGIHALSLDFRGFGESISEEYNVDVIQKSPQA